MLRKPKALPDYFTAEESQVLVAAAPCPRRHQMCPELKPGRNLQLGDDAE